MKKDCIAKEKRKKNNICVRKYIRVYVYYYSAHSRAITKVLWLTINLLGILFTFAVIKLVKFLWETLTH